MRRLLLILGVLASGGLFISWGAFGHVENSRTGGNPTASWLAYENKRFGFKFRYPPDFELTADPDAQFPDDPGLASDVVVGPTFTPPNRMPQEFEIIGYAKKSEAKDNYDDAPGFWYSSILDLIPKIHEMMAEEQLVGPVSTTTIASEEAFEFTVNDKIGWNDLGRAVDEQNVLVFLESTDTIFQISFPNTSSFNAILPTFELTSGVGG